MSQDDIKFDDLAHWDYKLTEKDLFYWSDKLMGFFIRKKNIAKSNKVWDKIKEALSIKFSSMPVYDEKYISSQSKRI